MLCLKTRGAETALAFDTVMPPPLVSLTLNFAALLPSPALYRCCKRANGCSANCRPCSSRCCERMGRWAAHALLLSGSLNLHRLFVAKV